MQSRSDEWLELAGSSNTTYEYKFIIDGTEYGSEAEVEHSVSYSLFEDLSIGNAAIGTLTLQLFADTVPKGATIERYVRLTDGTTTSEWIQKGIFYISTRSEDDGCWTITAYDAMRKAETTWEPDDDLTFPMAMSDAVDVLAALMGVTVDSRSDISADYTIDYPTDDYTIRNILCYIAAAHGGNWTISDTGTLYLVPLFPPDEVVEDINESVLSFTNNGIFEPVTQITLYVDEDNYYTAGDDEGIEISATCPYATQEMASALYSVLYGYEYQAFNAEAATVDPAIELGDVVTVCGITAAVEQITDSGDGYPGLCAPGETELEEEYPITTGTVTATLTKKIAETNSSITKTAEEIKLQIESTDEAVSLIQQTLDSISFSVSSPITGSDSSSYVSLTLTVGDYTSTGYVTISGNVDVSGSLSAEALYASLGDIADLTVNVLSTSRRIPLYLAGDTSDDNYIDIRDKTISLITGKTDGSYEQATNPNGALLYWDNDMDEATISSDGYPYLDGQRVYATTEETDWPVYIYTYTDTTKRQISFDGDDDNTPIDIFGAGYGDETDEDRGKGFIQKSSTSLNMWLLNSSGEEHGIYMGDDYTDITGMRKTKALDFSLFESGYFTETLDGDVEIDYTVEFDSEGRPITITDGDGHITTVMWE